MTLIFRVMLKSVFIVGFTRLRNLHFLQAESWYQRSKHIRDFLNNDAVYFIYLQKPPVYSTTLTIHIILQTAG